MTALTPGGTWAFVIAVVVLLVLAVTSPDPRSPLTVLSLVAAGLATALLLAELTARVGPPPPQLSDVILDVEPPAPVPSGP